MLIPLECTYFIGSLLSLVPWIFLYWYRKDLRKMILITSAFMAIYAFFTEYFFWTKDWWHPKTITGTKAGLEALITGFSIGGIISSIYLVVLNKKIVSDKKYKNIKLATLLMIFHLAALFLLVFVFNLSTFVASILVYSSTTLFIFVKRKDLILLSLVTGFATTLGSVPIFLTLFKFTPIFVQTTWVFDRISGILFLGIPIEDLIFFFLLGTFYCPLYFFVTGSKLSKK